VKTSRGSISVYVCGDQEKPALITYPDVALNCMFRFLVISSSFYLMGYFSFRFSLIYLKWVCVLSSCEVKFNYFRAFLVLLFESLLYFLCS
jgi:hypothetical protein